jgi:hypothetical protein
MKSSCMHEEVLKHASVTIAPLCVLECAEQMLPACGHSTLGTTQVQSKSNDSVE